MVKKKTIGMTSHGAELCKRFNLIVTSFFFYSIFTKLDIMINHLLYRLTLWNDVIIDITKCYNDGNKVSILTDHHNYLIILNQSIMKLRRIDDYY